MPQNQNIKPLRDALHALAGSSSRVSGIMREVARRIDGITSIEIETWRDSRPPVIDRLSRFTEQWWEDLQQAKQALDVAPTNLLDDPAKPAKDRWAAGVRKLLNRMEEPFYWQIITRREDETLAGVMIGHVETFGTPHWQEVLSSLASYGEDLQAVASTPEEQATDGVEPLWSIPMTLKEIGAALGDIDPRTVRSRYGDALHEVNRQTFQIDIRRVHAKYQNQFTPQ